MSSSYDTKTTIHGGWSPKLWQVISLFGGSLGALLLFYCFKYWRSKFQRRRHRRRTKIDGEDNSGVILTAASQKKAKEAWAATTSPSASSVATTTTSGDSFYCNLHAVHLLHGATSPDDELSRVKRLLREGTCGDALDFLRRFLDDDDDSLGSSVVSERLNARRFGRRRQHLLHVVAEAGCLKFLENLIRRLTRDVSYFKTEPETEHRSSIRQRLQSQRMLEVDDNEGCTPLAYAVCRGRRDMARALIEWGADVHARDRFDNSILMHAVTARDIEVVNDVLATWKDDEAATQKKRINHRNQHGCTALHFAVAENAVDIVEFLLAHGGDPYVTEAANGRTILHVAARLGQKCVFKHLVKKHGMSLLVSTCF